MSALLAGALISGALGLGKAIIGGVQAAKGSKNLNKLLANRPQYSIPEAYTKALGIYQNLAAGEMPGQRYYEDRIGQTSARAITAAERGAISSNVYQGAVESAQDKELQALQDLARMGVEWRTQQQQNLAQAQSQYGQLQERQWEINQFQPWEIRANMATEQRGAGWQNFAGGLGEIGSSIINLVGTKYYADVLGQSYGQGGGDPGLAEAFRQLAHNTFEKKRNENVNKLGVINQDIARKIMGF